MPDISQSLVYTNGNVLDVDLHNQNIYDDTDPAGIFSKCNGGIDADQLAGGFQVRQEHVWPEEASRLRSDHGLDDLDFLSNASGEADETINNQFVSIPGTGCRFHVPWAPAAIFWQWQVFVTCWRYQRVNDETPAAITLLPFIDNSPIPHLRRGMPATVHPADTNAASELRRNQSVCSFWLDLTHLQMAPGAGWHDADLRVWLGQVGTIDYLRRMTEGVSWPGSGTSQNYNRYILFNRLTVGARATSAFIIG